jgi:hypothetical protein
MGLSSSVSTNRVSVRLGSAMGFERENEGFKMRREPAAINEVYRFELILYFFFRITSFHVEKMFPVF